MSLNGNKRQRSLEIGKVRHECPVKAFAIMYAFLMRLGQFVGRLENSHWSGEEKAGKSYSGHPRTDQKLARKDEGPLPHKGNGPSVKSLCDASILLLRVHGRRLAVHRIHDRLKIKVQ